MRYLTIAAIAPLLLGSMSVSALADNAKASKDDNASKEVTSLAEAITRGKANLTFRYRAENVDQDGFADDAFASTLRTRLKYTTGTFNGFFGVLEFDDVSNIGGGDFNSTINGKTAYPVIADPQITEVNQAYLAYTGIDKTTLMAGRVAMNMNNQRFVGTVGWRQNDQTWDMTGFINKSIDNLTLTGAYVWNVNRIFGNDHPLGDLDTNTFIVDAKYTGLPFGTVTAYGLIIDLNDAPVVGLSSKTFGIRFDGKNKIGNGDLSFLYEVEFANQTDNADNPTDFSANYLNLSAGLSAHGFTAKIGFERLGSDGGSIAFQTPLATLHKFNGWSDKFLATPATGLDDFYGSISYKVQGDSPLKGLKFDAIYHDFSAASGGASYGRELNLQVSKKISKNYYAGLKFADYQTRGFSTDTQKIWFTLGANF